MKTSIFTYGDCSDFLGNFWKMLVYFICQRLVTLTLKFDYDIHSSFYYCLVQAKWNTRLIREKRLAQQEKTYFNETFISKKRLQEHKHFQIKLVLGHSRNVLKANHHHHHLFIHSIERSVLISLLIKRAQINMFMLRYLNAENYSTTNGYTFVCTQNGLR